MKRIALLAAVAVAALVPLVVVANSDSQTQPIARTSTTVTTKLVTAKDKKLLRKQASIIAKLQLRSWNCQDHMGLVRTQVSVTPWALPKSIKYRAWVQDLWTARFKACNAALQEKKRQWNWQVFPRWIIDLGVCESGGSGGARSGEPNWFAEGSSSHGTFYSAFNIGRTRYDGAAHHMGVRGWHEGVGVPSPYEQAMAVIGYVKLYGDGFTGRCAGIARSSW